MGSEFVIDLGVNTIAWKTNFQEANEVLNGFSERFAPMIDSVAEGSRQVGLAATAAAVSIGSLGAGLAAQGATAATPVLGLASALSRVGGIAGNLSVAFNNLKSGTSFGQKIVGSIGAVGAAAGLAALAIKGISMAMTAMGKDTESIDAIGKKIGQVATAATIAVLGIKAIGLAVSAMRSVAGVGIAAVTGAFRVLKTVVSSVPVGIGAVATSIGRLGSLGIGAARSGAAAIGSFAAQAGDSLGKVGQGVASIATSFAAGGLVGGVASIAGMLLASGTSLESLGLQGTAAEGAITKIRGALGGVGEWLSKIGSGLAQAGLGALGEMAERGQKYFQAFLQATQPLTDAIQNVWLPAVIGSTNGAESSFSSFFNFIEQNFGAWIFDSISALSEFVGNFDLYFQIAQQTLAMWASNSLLQASDLFANLGVWLNWFGDNWDKVLMSAADLAATVFINIGENLKSLFTEIWNWVSNGFQGDIKVDWKPLTEGFRSAISEWPDLIETELAETTPELEALFEELGKRQRDAKERGLALRATETGTSAEAGGAGEAGQPKALTAVLKGSQEAARSALAGIASISGTKQERILTSSRDALQHIAARVDKGLTIDVEEVNIG